MEEDLSALSLSDKKESLKHILNPTKTESVAILTGETCDTYLQKCKINILAELWGFYHTKVGHPCFSGWRDASMERIFFRRHSQGMLMCLYRTPEAPLDLKEFAWNLVLHNERLGLLIIKRGDDGSERLKMLFGASVSDPYHAGGSSDFFHVLGYVRPYHNELEAITNCMRADSLESKIMLEQISSPARRSAFQFESRPFFSPVVPSNELQRSIINGLSSKIEGIQGPPGTGKSTTIFHIIQNKLPVDFKALVTCVQNKALDSIAEKFGKTDLPFVVFGNPDRLGDSAKAYMLEAQVLRDRDVLNAEREQTRVGAIIALLQARLGAHIGTRFSRQPAWHRWWVAFMKRRHSLLVSDIATWSSHQHHTYATVERVKKVASAVIVENARAFLSTMDGLASATIPKSRTIAVIDEAGTVPEFKMPHLLTFGVEAIVAIGDQNQLQPFSHGQSVDGFFQRVVKALGGRVPMLKEQYRMHPVICGFVSDQFYDRLLTTAQSVAEKRLASGGGIQWRDYAHVNAESPQRDKKCNEVEVGLISHFMWNELHSLLGDGKSVAIVTFYKHQHKCLMAAGEACGFVRTEEETRRNKGVTRFKHAGFRIVTVDSMQGSEADVVILSCVRCNPRGILGFITNPNRLCVALSRARERLVIVGSSKTLVKNPVWRALFAKADK